MTSPIQINKYLSEKKDEILKATTGAIQHGQKIHINSPVGSGKTTMAIDIMESNPDKNFVVLFPQISISEQVKVKLVANGHEAVVVNSRTIDNVIAGNSESITNRIILSTVDSAYKLIDGIDITSENTVFIMDETHTYLQNPRDNHTRTIEAILEGGFPIIGFSATPSSWVNKFLLQVDKEIEFEFINERKHLVNQTTVKKGLLRTVAEEITSDTEGLVVVYTENKKNQEQLKKDLLALDDSIKVCLFNSETKNTTYKTEWQYLMNHDKLTANYDVYLINSVAQAGVNITNKDIHRVYLVDCFDPFGFAQYLGRCRNYTKSFYYYSSTYGKQLEAFDSNKIQKRIDFMTTVLSSDNEEIKQLVKQLKPTISDQVSQDNKNNLVVDRCKIANSVYSELRGLSGDDLMLVIQELFSDVEFTEMPELDGITVTPASSQRKSRKNAQDKLKEKIMEEQDLINELNTKLNFNYSKASILSAIDKHYNSIGLKTFQKKGSKLEEILEIAEKAQFPLKRLFETNSLFRQSQFHEEVLEELLSLNGNKFNHINAAIKFFGGTTSATIKKLMKDVYPQKGELLTAREWRKILNSDVQNPTNSSMLIDNLYKFCLHTTRSNGKLRLDKINETIEDYMETYDFKHLVYYQGKLSPK